MLQRTDVLDHGYLGEVEHWGSDERIIEAARMSTDKGFLGWGPLNCAGCVGTGMQWKDLVTQEWLGSSHPTAPGVIGHYGQSQCPKCKGEGTLQGDEKLLAYLWENWHHTPFEMAGMVIEVQAPIFVFREWHRHRTQSYNELSARYTVLPDLYYVPSKDRLRMSYQATTNKQSSVEAPWDDMQLTLLQDAFRASHLRQRRQYEDLLAMGLSREVARIVIPVAQYSRMRASANLRNWLAFLTLRMDPRAQYEIRQFANVLGENIKEAYPRTWELFLKNKRW